MVVFSTVAKCSLYPEPSVDSTVHFWRKGNLYLGIVASLAIALLFVVGTINISTIPITEATQSSDLKVQELKIDGNAGTVCATIDVAPFKYSVNN